MGLFKLPSEYATYLWFSHQELADTDAPGHDHPDFGMIIELPEGAPSKDYVPQGFEGSRTRNSRPPRKSTKAKTTTPKASNPRGERSANPKNNRDRSKGEKRRGARNA